MRMKPSRSEWYNEDLDATQELPRYRNQRQQYRRPQQPMRPRRRKRRHILPIILLILLALIAAGLLFANHLLNSYNYDDTNESVMTVEDDVVNIALFGVDTRAEDESSGTRSDAMMIMSVSKKTGTIKLVSLMRDSYVNVPDHGMTKLCHSYSYGGPQLTIDTINQDFDMNISEYIAVDFGEMANIIDSVGGVRINVTKAERKETNKYIKEYCKANGLKYKPNKIKRHGEQKLNGVQAMTYGRIRKGNTGGDWSRTERQSVVLEKVFAKATSNPYYFCRFMNGLMPNITTSLSKDDLMLLAKTALSGGKPKIEHIRLPLDGEWNYGTTADGMSVITFNDEVLAKHLKEYFYDDVEPEAVTEQADTSSEESSSEDTSSEDSYSEDESYDSSYSEESYSEESYPEESYSEESYPEDGYSDDGYSEDDYSSEENY